MLTKWRRPPADEQKSDHPRSASWMERTAAGFLAVAMLAGPVAASAATCANGVYRAGCVGPNGAVVAKKPPPAPSRVTCASGAYHAGCVGPNGAVATTKTPSPNCYWRAGVRVCR